MGMDMVQLQQPTRSRSRSSTFGFLSLVICACTFFLPTVTPPNPINYIYYWHRGLHYICISVSGNHADDEYFALASFKYYNLFLLSSLLLLILGLSSVRRLSLSLSLGRRRHDQLLSLIWGKLTHPIRNAWSVRSDGRSSKSLKMMRSLLRRERKKRKEAMAELEREREASAWATEEAMAKIMVLEREKARVEREARQYRQMMEQQQLHDEEVIHHLLHLLHQHQTLTRKSFFSAASSARWGWQWDDAFGAVGSDGDQGPHSESSESEMK